MLDVGVYAAVGQQAVQVQAAAFAQAVVHGLVIGLIFKEAAVVNGAADAGQILKYHTAAADVGVADLAVAHLPGGQAHVQSAGGQSGVGIFLEQPIQHRRLGQRYGVVVAGRGQAEAVHDDKRSGRLIHDGTFLSSVLVLIGCVDDLHEFGGLQAGAADQAAVDIALAQ